jgi:UDP-N-acetylglucosamine:LPS N-acetylglucosamine transferase
MADPSKMDQLSANIKKLAKPDAATKIVEVLEKMIA